MKSPRIVMAALLAAVIAAILIWHFVPSRTETKPKLGLMTSLPIYWSNPAEFGAALSRQNAAHPLRTQLEQRYHLVPLDILAVPDGIAPGPELAALDRLLLAQPAPLPPADFAALDAWVRAGGELLMFVDPQLTEHSEFGLGDKRRPQDIAMLGPILARWGLIQSEIADVKKVQWRGISIPMEQAGRFTLSASDVAQCQLAADNTIAECRIGTGYAVIVGDAAILDRDMASAQTQDALSALVSRAFNPR